MLPSEGATGLLAENLFALLQATALVGLFAIVTYGLRAAERPWPRANLRYGIAFGLAGFFLAFFVMSFIQGPWKPYLRNDALFLGGLLGGWSGGAVSFALLFAARWFFGGPAYLPAAFVDMALISLAGVAAHDYVRRRVTDRLRLRLIAIICAIRVAVGLLAPLVPWAMGLLPWELLKSAIGGRSAVIPLTVGIVGVILLFVRQDIFERRRAERLREADRRDGLTGLPNRRALAEHVDAERLAGRRGMLAIVGLSNAARTSVDKGPDWFAEFWERAAEQLADGSLGPLFGGARPVVFLFDDMALAVVVRGRSMDDEDLERDLALLRSTLRESDEDAPLGELLDLHVVAADLPSGPGGGTDRFLRNVAQMLHRHDEPVTLFRHSVFEKFEQEARIRETIASWIAGERVPLHYQPKVRLADGAIVGAEALLRATDIDGTRLAPELVIDIAERSHLAGELEWRTIQTGLRDALRAAAAGMRLSISVNISAVSLTQQGFASRVVGELRSLAIEPDILVLEMTEMRLVPDIAVVHDNVTQLRESGLGLSLDDFGAGWSALTMLARFDVSEIKVDRFLTSRLEQPRMQEAMQLAIESGRRYGAQVVVEGVETEEQRDILAAKGVEYGQGFLFSPAVPLEDLLALMASRPPSAPSPTDPPDAPPATTR